jgi:hypothetical protein
MNSREKPTTKHNLTGKENKKAEIDIPAGVQ